MSFSACETNCADLNRTVFDVLSLDTQVTTLEDTVYADVQSGDTAWMLFATQLTLLLTLPGLLLYYAGYSKFKNVMTMSLFVISAVSLVTVEWMAFGYSFAYGPRGAEFKGKAGYQWYGDASRVWVRGMKLDTTHNSAPSIPEAQFFFFELTLVILAVVIAVSGIVNRFKYESFVVFQLLWVPIVYCPLAHMFRHEEGFWTKLGARDYAGGLVVFVPAGVTAIAAAFFAGPSKSWVAGEKPTQAINPLLSLIGAALLWVGFLGLTGGSMYTAGPRSAYAVFVTQISASSASLMWLSCETIMTGKPSILGFVKGMLAGLVAISPCAGAVDFNGAFWIGFFAGPCCLFASAFKDMLAIDDALDAFAIFGFGGLVGGIANGFYAMDVVSEERLVVGAFAASTRHGGHFMAYQLAATLFSFAYSLFMSSILLMIVDLVMGLKVDDEWEVDGLDYHGTVEQLPDVAGRTLQMQMTDDEFRELDMEEMRMGLKLASKSYEDDEYPMPPLVEFKT
jgi:Amt family ammonium transporter